MTPYRIDLAPDAMKDLRRITDRRLHKRLTDRIAELGVDPRPIGSLKLVGELNQWRVRVGDWRIIYRVDDGRLVVLFVEAGGRKEVFP